VFLAVRQITDDPLRLEVGGTKFEIDLAVPVVAYETFFKREFAQISCLMISN
jgi:hypothetical protein